MSQERGRVDVLPPTLCDETAKDGAPERWWVGAEKDYGLHPTLSAKDGAPEHWYEASRQRSEEPRKQGQNAGVLPHSTPLRVRMTR
jgi:hypothetical protein